MNILSRDTYFLKEIFYIILFKHVTRGARAAYNTKITSLRYSYNQFLISAYDEDSIMRWVSSCRNWWRACNLGGSIRTSHGAKPVASSSQHISDILAAAPAVFPHTPTRYVRLWRMVVVSCECYILESWESIHFTIPHTMVDICLAHYFATIISNVTDEQWFLPKNRLYLGYSIIAITF